MITGTGVHDRPESAFTIDWNECSRSTGIGVHDPPERAAWRRGARSVREGFRPGSAPVREKRVGLSRGPHRRLWAFNGPRWYRSVPLRGVAAGRVGAFATATRPAICQLGLDLSGWAGRWDRNGARGPSVRTPMPRTVRLHAVATSIRAHDVFGTSTQLSGRATHPITTMMPVRQCGHSRNDCPVSA